MEPTWAGFSVNWHEPQGDCSVAAFRRGSPACQPICHPVISSILESRSLGIVDKAHRARSRYFSLGLAKGRQGWQTAKDDQGLVLVEKTF